MSASGSVGMSQKGQSRHFDRGPVPSGLPRSTDIVRPPVRGPRRRAVRSPGRSAGEFPDSSKPETGTTRAPPRPDAPARLRHDRSLIFGPGKKLELRSARGAGIEGERIYDAVSSCGRLPDRPGPSLRARPIEAGAIPAPHGCSDTHAVDLGELRLRLPRHSAPPRPRSRTATAWACGRTSCPFALPAGSLLHSACGSDCARTRQCRP